MSDPPQLNRAIAEQFNRVETTLCLSTKVIVITEDQLELRVQDGMQKLSASDSWIAPLSILLTCVATLFTAEFKNFSWVASGTLKGVFVAATAASCIWLVLSVCRIKKFGRREFMTSIRTAGSPFNYSQGMLASSQESPANAETAASQSGMQQRDAANGPLQCKQCGNILPDPIPGQMTRCPMCGTLS